MKASPPRPRPPRSGAAARGRLLLIVDNAPIRARLLEEYQAAEAALEKTRAEWRRYEEQDLPAFRRWEAQTLGPLQTELRDLESALHEKHGLLLEVDQEELWSGCGRLTAYRRVMKARERAEALPEGEWEGEPGGEEEAPKMFGDSDLPPGMTAEKFAAMSRQEQKRFRAAYREAAMIFALQTGCLPPELDEVLGRESMRREESASREATLPGAPRPAGEGRGSRLKQLYRQLVRRLHPDTAAVQTLRIRELWRQVQEAYGTGDVEKLEALLGLVDSGTMLFSPSLPLPVLRRMLEETLASLRSLRLQVGTARKEPAWRFAAEPARRAKLEKKRRRELEETLRRTRAALSFAEQELATLAARAARPGARPKARPRRSARSARSRDASFW